MLYVCLLSRYISPIVEICYMLNVCLLSRYQPCSRDLLYVKYLLSGYISPVVEICYMFVCCPVISAL